MLPAERHLYDHALTFLVEMLISDNVDVGYSLFDQLTLGSKLASVKDVNRRVLFHEELGGVRPRIWTWHSLRRQKPWRSSLS